MDSYKRFYEVHKDRLFNYLIRMTGNYDLSRDILQESFTRYIEKYRDRPLKASLLFTIARNALYDTYRKMKAQTEIPDDMADESENLEHQILIREEYRHMLKAVQFLGHRERDVLSLAAGGDLSYQDIAAITGMTLSNIKVTVHRARLKLRDILKELNDGIEHQHVSGQ